MSSDAMAEGPRAGVRQARLADVPEIVRIHQASFPGFFMTLLGPAFLGQYYGHVLAYPRHVFWVKEGPAGLEGFVAGFLDPRQFYQGMKNARRSLILPTLTRVVLRPWLVPRLIASYAQAGKFGRDGDPDSCELASLAVHPSLGGRGIGKALVQAFMESVRGRAKRIVLTTDARGNDSVNRFYQSLGFSLVGSYERSRGRSVNCYAITLPCSDSSDE